MEVGGRKQAAAATARAHAPVVRQHHLPLLRLGVAFVEGPRRADVLAELVVALARQVEPLRCLAGLKCTGTGEERGG